MLLRMSGTSYVNINTMKKIQNGNINIVIVITKSDPVGGAQIHVKDLAEALHDVGNRVTVLIGEEGSFTKMLSKIDVEFQIIPNLVREINPIKDWKGLSELRQALRQIQPDLVATHSSKAGILGRIAAHKEKIPATFTVHGWAFTDGVSKKKQMIYQMIETAIAKFPAQLIAVSEFDRQLGIKKKVCPEQQITAVQNGMPDIDPSLFAKPAEGPVKIIMVARFDHQKDHKSLIHALGALKDREWELLLVGGDGGLQDQAENAITTLGLENKVQILGYRSDIDQLMADSHIFVLSSNWEGFPLTILEAMRTKLPVIASDVGGVKEAISHGETGFVTSNQEELQHCLQQLIDNPELRKEMGEQGRERYLEHFTVQSMLDKTFTVYDKLLANDPYHS